MLMMIIMRRGDTVWRVLTEAPRVRMSNPHNDLTAGGH